MPIYLRDQSAGNCTFNSTVIGFSHSDGITLVTGLDSAQNLSSATPVNTIERHVTQAIHIDLSKHDANKTIELTYQLINGWLQYPDHSLTQKITIEIVVPFDPNSLKLDPCTPDLTVDKTEVQSSYLLKQGGPVLVLDLQGISNNDCEYELQLKQDGIKPDGQIFQVHQPTFKRTELNRLQFT